MPTQEVKKIGILGGGLAAVSLAHFLDPKKYKVTILEKENRPGGLCRTFRARQFHYDIGGHIIFSKDQEMLRFMKKILGKDKRKGFRNAKVFFKDRFVKYPFENGLSALPFKDKFECLWYYFFNKNKKSDDFRGWLYHNFGKGIAEKYLIPYNQKLWREPLERMDTAWVGRVPKPPALDILKSSLGIHTEGKRHQLFFYYPKIGGIETLIKKIVKMGKNLEIITNYEIKRIDYKNKKWIVSNDKEPKVFDQIISTIPLPELANCLERIDHEIKKAVNKLRYNSLILVFIGLREIVMKNVLSFLVADPKIFGHRICLMRNFSRALVPNKKSALTAEITVKMNSKLWQTPDKDLAQNIKEWLEEKKLISPSAPCALDVKRIQYAYIVYNRYYSKTIDKIREYFQRKGIFLLGRFGNFEYINMDATIRKAKNLAKQFNA